MGQKIHPTGFRLAVTRDWSSRWYANNKNFSTMLNEDVQVRDYLKGKLKHAYVSRVLIERPAKNARVTVFSARPGVVIGKKGEEIDQLRSALQKIMRVPVHVSIEEIRKPELDAQLIADSITQQLEKRIMFRRAMKRAMQSAMRLGAQGIKIMSSGRLNGAEIARREWYREGRVPLHTLRADIDYATSEALTTYGIIGVKVWIFKGEILNRDEQPEVAAPGAAAVEEPARKPRRVARPAGEGDKVRRVAGKPKGEGQPKDEGQPKSEGQAEDAGAKPAAEGKAPAKRVRKAGTTDVAAN
jgi:small subunit ribosomal protein S3